MRLLFLNQHFGADQGATGQLLEELSTELAKRGNAVEIIASAAPYEAHPPQTGQTELKIKRVGSKRRQGRLVGYLTYHLCAAMAELKVAPNTIIVAQSSPPMLLVSAAAVASMKSAPLVHVAQDLYPDVAEALGVLRPNSAVASSLRALRGAAIRRCKAVIVPGQEMAERLERADCPPEKIIVVPNWADPPRIAPSLELVLALRKKLDIGDRKVIMYAGNLGLVHSYRELLDVAQAWRGRPDRIILFMGGGPRFAAAREEVRQCGLEQVVRFGSYVNRHELDGVMALADVHVATQRQETFGTVVPSKVYGALAAGRPITFVGPGGGEIERVLSESRAGTRINPGDARSLEQALDGYLLNDSKRTAEGHAGLSWTKTFGGLHRATKCYEDVFRAAIA